jgi:hypothetical protein
MVRLSKMPEHFSQGDKGLDREYNLGSSPYEAEIVTEKPKR